MNDKVFLSLVVSISIVIGGAITLTMQSSRNELYKEKKIREVDISHRELIMAAYEAAWIDGANAVTDCVNNGEHFNPVIAVELFKRDSTRFESKVFKN